MAGRSGTEALRDAVREVLAALGPGLLESPGKFYAALADLLPFGAEGEMRVLCGVLAGEGDADLLSGLARLSASSAASDVEAERRRIEARLSGVHQRRRGVSDSCARGLAWGVADYLGISPAEQKREDGPSKGRAGDRLDADATAVSQARPLTPPYTEATAVNRAESQVSSDSQAKGGKATGVGRTRPVLVLVVALVFVGVLVGVLARPNTGGDPGPLDGGAESSLESPEEEAGADGSSTSVARQDDDAKKVLDSLDGWWAQVGGLGSDTRSGYRLVRHFNGGECDTYDGDGNKTEWTTIATTQVTRMDNGPGGNGDSGWYIYNVNLFLSDGNPNLLVAIGHDGSNYSGTSSFERIDGEPDWSEVGKKADDGTGLTGPFTLEGVVRVNAVLVNGDSTNIVAIELDEPVRYQYEYKGTVEDTAGKVELSKLGNDDYYTWEAYDGLRVRVTCDRLQGAIHDASMHGVDAIAMGNLNLEWSEERPTDDGEKLSAQENGTQTKQQVEYQTDVQLGAYVVAGRVHAHQENYAPNIHVSQNEHPAAGSEVGVVSLVVDEPFEYDSYGHVATDLLLGQTLNGSYDNWIQYDGQHITVTFDSIISPPGPDTQLNVDAETPSQPRLVSVG